MPRFKIDFYSSSYTPFGFYVYKRKWWRNGIWEIVNTFKTKEEAEEYYNLIKDLPEYLD